MPRRPRRGIAFESPPKARVTATGTAGAARAHRERKAPVVAFWWKYDINARVAISHHLCVACPQIPELVGAANHHHEPVRVQVGRRFMGPGDRAVWATRLPAGFASLLDACDATSALGAVAWAGAPHPITCCHRGSECSDAKSSPSAASCRTRGGPSASACARCSKAASVLPLSASKQAAL